MPRRGRLSQCDVDRLVADWTAKGIVSQQKKPVIAFADTEINVTLPVPPTTNNLYVNVIGRGRVPSKAYTKWKKSVAPIVGSLPKWSGEYPVAIDILIVCGKGWREDSDCANREKAPVDALVEHGVIEGDTCLHVRPIKMDYDPTGSRQVPPVVKVTIRKSLNAK